MESFAICALLHDVCKSQFYKTSTRNVKNDETGQWEKRPFYTVDDATQTVHIVRFLYGKSNWITILKTDAANGSLPVFS